MVEGFKKVRKKIVNSIHLHHITWKVKEKYACWIKRFLQLIKISKEEINLLDLLIHPYNVKDQNRKHFDRMLWNIFVKHYNTWTESE